jgi:hypothetical protein
MKILFLDDMPVRHEAFLRNHIGHSVDQVWDAKQAIERLNENVYDVACLDHDLAEEHYEQFEAHEYSPGTGMDVVDYICVMPLEKRPKNVIIHSLNPRGVEMVNRLLDAGVRAMRAPFRPSLRIA